MKLNLINKTCTTALMLTLLSVTSMAQTTLKTPAPSPSQTIKQNFGIGDITVDYSRPSCKNRVVFGEVVPFGKAWRTGANGATKITFSDSVMIEGTTVKAGTYALYTMPNSKESWDVMLNTDLTLGGNTTGYKPENDVLHVKVKPTVYGEKVETFTISFADLTATSATLELIWEKTRVPLHITTSIDDKIMGNIQSVMNTDSRPYFQSANYYYENNKDLNQALVWVNKAIEQNPKAFYMVMLKARIELKLKDNKSAIASAEKTITLAKDAKNDDYVKMAQALIVEANKK